MSKSNKPTGLMSKMQSDTKDGALDPSKAGSAPTNQDPPKQDPPKQDPPKQDPPKQEPPKQEPTTLDPPKPDEIRSKMRQLPGVSNEPEPTKVDFDAEAFDRETESHKDKTEIEFKVFAELRNELKKFKQGEALPDAVKTRLAELEEKAAKVDQYEEEVSGLRDRVTKLASTSAVALVEASDLYQNTVELPEKAVKGTINQLAEVTKLSVEDLTKVVYETDMGKQDAMIENLAGKLNTRQLSRLSTICNDIHDLAQTRNNLLANAEEHLAEQNRLRDENRNKEIANHVDKVKAQGKRFHESFLRDIPGLVNDEGNMTDVAKKIARGIASTDPASMDHEDEGFAIYAAVALPELAQLLRDEREHRMKLEKELGAKEAARPKMSDGSSGAQSSGPSSPRRGLLASLRAQEFQS